ncbi:MAG: YgfZ/GcvT domain-containing protein [Oceanococcus sp.]
MDTETLHKQLYATSGTSSALDLCKIQVRGEDAQDFLQGQLTADLRLLEVKTHQITTWCNAKGRVWCVLRIWRQDEGFDLLIANDQADAFLKRLRMFILRAKVSIEKPDTPVYAQIDDTDAGKGQLETLKHGLALHLDKNHCLLVSTTPPMAMNDSIGLHYVALRILAGEAQINAINQEKFLPQSLGIAELGGLHFNKGCYVGQEIVARVHYRGKSPQRLGYELEPSAESLHGKSVICEVQTALGPLVQWVENIKG